MGALAGLFIFDALERRVPLSGPLALAALSALGGSYFQSPVAVRGLASPWEDAIQQAAVSAGVDPLLIKAVISAESEWQPSVGSADGSSWGLMQLNVHAQGITQAQALDPSFAIPFGARILAGQLARRASLELALAGYNAGTSRTDQDLAQRMRADTLGVGSYVQTVLDYFAWYQRQAAAVTPADFSTVPVDILSPGPAAAAIAPADASGATLVDTAWPWDPGGLSPAADTSGATPADWLTQQLEGAGAAAAPPWGLIGVGVVGLLVATIVLVGPRR